VIPTREAQALVAYLLSLKQAPLTAGDAAAGAAMNGGAAAQMPAPAPGEAMADMRGMSAAAPAAGGAAANIGHGKDLFTANCAVCQQASGEGLTGVFPPLKGNTAVNDADATLHIRTVLFGTHGVAIGGIKYASPMPPFGPQLSDQDVADLIDYERSAWGNHGRPVNRADVAAVRARGQ
jgi:cytochrome c oxidase cbb3-type subunit 2